MGKKVYHVVDPETGEVVGKKRVGRIGQGYYKTPPTGRALYVLMFVPVFFMLASAVLCVFSFFVPSRIASLFGSLVGINAVLGIILIFLWFALNERCQKSKNNGEAKDEQHKP